MRSINEIEEDLRRFENGRKALAELQMEIDLAEKPVLLELEQAKTAQRQIRVRRAAIKVTEKEWFYHRVFIARHDTSGERGWKWLADLKADAFRVLSSMDIDPQQKTYFARKRDLQAAIALAVNAYIVGVFDGAAGVSPEDCIADVAQVFINGHHK